MSRHEQRRPGTSTTAHPTETHGTADAPRCTGGCRLRDERTLARIVHDAVERTGRRTCWVVFLAPGDASACFVMAMDDLPEHPDDDEVSDLVHLVADLVSQIGAEEVIVAWERSRDDFGRADWEWVQAVEHAFAVEGAPLRGQTVVHERGVAWLCLDAEGAA